MAVEIRVLEPADADLLGAIGSDVFDDALDWRATTAFLRDPRHHIVVAIDDGVVVGFASAVDYLHPDKPAPELWINEVGVAATHRGRGVGKAIFEKLFEHARGLGCVEAWVLTDRTNQGAMRLYTSSGGIESSPDPVMFTFRLSTTASDV
jgi:GNAT superfamily N-acetyltransferase